jgi:cyclopropane-fatty-acyl-phospholipid synthase
MQMWRLTAQTLLSQIRVGSLTVVEGAHRRTFGAGTPAALINVNRPDFWRMLMKGSRGLAESYATGGWDSPDLVAVIRLAARNAVLIDRVRAYTTPFWAPHQRVRAALNRSTRERSREHIAFHYDIGNELFTRMLDPSMMYSCALFERDGMTLEEASVAKLERVCQRLEIGPEDHVLEIGTGWGGFAVHAARTRGCRVTTTTISREQRDYAVQRVAQAGLSDRVEVIMRDYRDLAGTYDKLVSIEMIEAVGWKHIGTFFEKCSQLLTPHGAMLLQAITIDDRAYEVEKASRSFIKEYIFPGGALPSMEVITRNVARRTDLQTVGLEDITDSYVETLRRWRHNFNHHAGELAEFGYDETFRRMWNLYLAYCEGGFAERRICDVQVLLAKPHWAVKARSGRHSAAVAATSSAPAAAPMNDAAWAGGGIGG